MRSNVFDKSIESNKIFWSKVNRKDSDNGCLLYEIFYSEPAMIYGISKVALSIARHKELKPICITGLRGKKEKFALIESMNNFIVGDPFCFFLSSLKKSFSLLKCIFSIKSNKDLIKLKIKGCDIGPYIYDAVLKTLNLPEVSEITFSIRKVIVLELCYFYFFKDLLGKHNIKAIVLGDNTYRPGLLFELAKNNGIECIAPVNLNGFSMCKFVNEKDFEFHDRRPSKNALKVLDDKLIEGYLEIYFSRRFSASLEQHDVLKAFSSKKNIYNRLDIVEQYGLNEKLPIVAVMCHIFCDAPNGYPGTIYDDYKEWLINTVENLKENKAINFLIKEHPSSDLYNEKGVVNTILKDIGCERFLLKDNVHSSTILNEFDVVVTCGGTIGQEFSYKGKPVVLAAKPSYSGFGFTEEPESKAEYESLMRSGIEKLRVLDSDQRKMVNKVIYHDFVLLDNYSKNLEIGGERFYMGRDFDHETFFTQVLKYNKTPLYEQLVYQEVERFIDSGSKHLLRGYE